MIFTFGTAYVFEEVATGRIVGNCHRIAAREFRRRRLTEDEIVSLWTPLLEEAALAGRKVVFTVSPIRHTADTLHGNTLSKALLHLSIDRLTEAFPQTAMYFPAFEALVDDLRGYEYYAADGKHPAPEAIDYIFELFHKTFIET